MHRILTLGLSLALVCLLSPVFGVSPADAKEAVVISTAAVGGEVVSCGCKKKDLGGISRRATVIAKERAKSDAVLLVDAGDFGSKDEFEPWMLTEFQWKMMKEMGYDVVTLGPNELREGLAPLKKMLATAPEIQVVSANLTDKSGKLLFPKYTVVEKGGVTYGITAATAESFYLYNKSRGEQKRDDFGFLDVKESLAAVVPELRAKAEVVVVLLHASPGEAKRMVADLSGTDVMVVGHNPGYMFTPQREANTLLVRGGNRGQYVHVLKLTMDDAGKITDFAGESRPLGDGVAKHEAFDAVADNFDAKYKELKGVEDPHAGHGH